MFFVLFQYFNESHKKLIVYLVLNLIILVKTVQVSNT